MAGLAVLCVPASCAQRAGTSPAAQTGAARQPCGKSRRKHAAYRHVVWIVMENKSLSDVIGSSHASFINSLARKCGVALNFFAESHPSLPNYIAMTSGSTQGVSDDDGPSAHPLRVQSLFSQLGSGWRALEESMPSRCQRSNGDRYAVRHNPAVYYTGIRGVCAKRDVPLGPRPDLSARFTFVTPNLCNDMHDCSVATGDAWLKGFMSKVFHTHEYRSSRTVVFITWDEGGGSQRIPTLVVSPTTRPGTRSNASYSHYSLLRSTEQLLGLPPLGQAASAASMLHEFSL
jgi:hypothetical protein